MSHTPGPLHAVRINDSDQPFAVITHNGPAGDKIVAGFLQKDDAVLFAAAPDLLEALKGLLADCVEYARINNLHNDDGSPATDHAMWRADAAIAKAEGRS